MSKIHHWSVFCKACCLIVLATPLLAVDSLGPPGKLTSTKEDLELPKELAAKINPDAHSYCPLSSMRYAEHHRWFLSKLQHLKTFIGVEGNADQVKGWEQQYQPSVLIREICQSYPDTTRLRQAYEDSFETFVEDQDRVERQANLLRLVALSFQKYLVTLEDQRDPHSATLRLRSDLTDLKLRLHKYGEGQGVGQITNYSEYRKELDQLTAIHQIVKRIEISEQAAALIQEIRSSYMQPKARLHFSTKLLTKVIDIPLPTMPMERYRDNGSTVGTLKANDRLHVFSRPNLVRGELGVGYQGTFTFCGTLNVKKPIKRCTGLQMRLCQNTHKALLLEANAPDSDRTQSASSLVSAKTQRGRIFDCLVTPSLRKGVASDPINQTLSQGIDNAITFIGNLVVERASDALDKVSGDTFYPRERQYYSTGNSIEVVVYSAQSGFIRQPLTIPSASGSDFDFTLHSSIRSTSPDKRRLVFEAFAEQLKLGRKLEETIRSLRENDQILVDDSNGPAVQIEGGRVTLRLKLNGKSVKLIEGRQSDGTLRVEVSADSEGRAEAETLLAELRQELKGAYIEVRKARQIFPLGEASDYKTPDTRIDGFRVLFNDGYISLRGTL
ncbi:MAG: hypothetical protein AAF483_22745 [Planctomycetota bacterium]